MKKGRITLILLLLLIMTIVRYSSSSMVSKPVASITGTTEYEQHDPIKITNDNDFASYGFEGFGTPDEPYLIDGYNITDSTTYLILIKDTVVYFKISNCYLNGLGSNFRGIALVNVTHGIIDSNIICNLNYGIALSPSCNSNTLSSNTIYNCLTDGIYLYDSSNNNVLSSNTIYNCSVDGIYLYWSCTYNTLSSNTIYNCAKNGIKLVFNNSYNTFSSNTISDCSDGIRFDTNNSYNTLSSNFVYDCSSSGISAGYNSDYSTLSNNTVYNVQSGIGVTGSYCTLSNNTVYNVIGGISVSGPYPYRDSYSTLSNNTVYNCSTGMSLSFANYCTLSNNTIYNCSFMGLSLYNSNHSTVSSNTVYNSTQYGVVLRESSSYNTLSNNTISHCFFEGIYLYEGDSCSYNTLSYNTVDKCSKNSIIPDWPSSICLGWSSSYNTLSYNTISHCPDNGIALRGSNHSTLFSNIIYNCSKSGIYLSGSNHNTLSSNMISNCSGNGIHLASYNHYNTLSSNMISNCSGNGIRLYSLSEDNTLSSNTISHCSVNGIELSGLADYNTLSHNAISNCSNYGIGLFSSNNNILSNNTIYNNSNYGFYFGDNGQSNDNIAQWNNFLNNSEGSGTAQACDDTLSTTTNVFSDNYWHDYLGSGNYTLDSDGPIRNNDTSPLATPGPPLVTIVTPFNQTYSADTISVILSGNAVQYWYYIEGIDGDNQTWRTREERPLNDDPYTLHAYGKILSTISHVSVMFTIDTTPPTLNIESPDQTTYDTTNTITVDLSGTDVAHYWYFIEGFHVDNQPWTGSASWTLDDGAYILHAYANDSVGNTASISFAFTIDTVPPTITLESPPIDTTHNSRTIIKVNVIDVFLDTVLFNWDGSPNKTWNKDYEFWTLLPISEAQHFLNVYANDSLGRWTSEEFVFTTDDTNPAVDITSPKNDTTYDQNSITLTYTVSEGTVTIYINGKTNTTALPSETIISDLSNGTYNITIVAVDSAGNIGNDSVIFTIEIPEEESSETTSETSSETTTKAKKSEEIGSFPGLFTVLLFLVPIVIVLRRHKH